MDLPAEAHATRTAGRQVARIFLCGDVMTGRAIDQVLPHPCDPRIHERYMRSATDYVLLAEEKNGPIPRDVKFSYIWGAALPELHRMQPDVRIINLETSITRKETFSPKGINYRMSPENAVCLVPADVDCCVLANNHVLDWGYGGLGDTLASLEFLRIRSAGAGVDLDQASGPAIFDITEGARVVVFAVAVVTSGAPATWAAGSKTAGINLLTELSEQSAALLADRMSYASRPGDVVVLSIHWGPNWGYEVPAEHMRFARALIDRASVSIVHGHSSHHPMAIEVYRNRLILYGCGDFLNDYEGIGGSEEFLDDLTLMYFADVDPVSADLVGLEMVPLQLRRFRLVHPSAKDRDWLLRTLDRECRRFGTRIELKPDGRLALSWDRDRSESTSESTG